MKHQHRPRMNTDQITKTLVTDMIDHMLPRKINAIIADQLGINPDPITPTATFIEDLGADSLDIVELTMAYEEEFDIEITDEEAVACLTVGDAIALIERKLGEKGVES